MANSLLFRSKVTTGFIAGCEILRRLPITHDEESGGTMSSKTIGTASYDSEGFLVIELDDVQEAQSTAHLLRETDAFVESGLSGLA